MTLKSFLPAVCRAVLWDFHCSPVKFKISHVNVKNVGITTLPSFNHLCILSFCTYNALKYM